MPGSGPLQISQWIVDKENITEYSGLKKQKKE